MLHLHCLLYFLSFHALVSGKLCKMLETRSSLAIPLIGEPLDSFGGEFLPTTQDVLRVYFFYHRVKGWTQKDAVKEVSEKIHVLWSKIDLPIIEMKNVVRKLQMEVQNYRAIVRNIKRSSQAQRTRETNFVQSIPKLFDISCKDALNTLDDEDVKEFLIDQQTKRQFEMRRLLLDRGERQKGDHECERTKQAQNEEVELLTHTMSNLSSNTGSFMSNEVLSRNSSSYSVEFANELASKPKKPPRKKILSENVIAALDRTNVSNASATHILAAQVVDSGGNLDNISLSVNTVRRRRIAHRSQDRSTFTADGPRVLHFDGKLFPALSGCNKEERIAIVVSGDKTEKLLGVPKVDRGTGSLIANAAFSLVTEWQLQDKIVALGFDTPAVNTGLKNRVNVLLQQKMNKRLLWLTCRHHMMEIVCRDVFKAGFGLTKRPNVTLFKKFRDF